MLMPERVVSRWAKAARALGVFWLAAAVAGALADRMLTEPDPQAMFGGHVIASIMLWIGAWVVAVVLVCGAVAVVRARLRPDVAAGWSAIAVGVVAAAAGCGVLFWSFVS
jgi:hypothetical protein